jgi:hypothetical protein
MDGLMPPLGLIAVAHDRLPAAPITCLCILTEEFPQLRLHRLRHPLTRAYPHQLCQRVCAHPWHRHSHHAILTHGVPRYHLSNDVPACEFFTKNM